MKTLDAGFKHDPEAQDKFRFRGQGITIPTLSELIEGTSGAHYLMEIKQASPSIAEQLCKTLRQHKIEQKTMVASFMDDTLKEFRSLCPEVVTSMSAREIKHFVILEKLGLSHLLPVKGYAMQVPMEDSGIQVVTPSLLEAARKRGIRVDVWTINDTDIMEMGVEGIITDYPDRLNALLSES